MGVFLWARFPCSELLKSGHVLEAPVGGATCVQNKNEGGTSGAGQDAGYDLTFGVWILGCKHDLFHC